MKKFLLLPLAAALAALSCNTSFAAVLASDNAANSAYFIAGASPDKRHFDLPAFVLGRLRRAGVGTCAWIGADTCSDEQRFYSNRRAFRAGEPDFGRLLSAITLV